MAVVIETKITPQRLGKRKIQRARVLRIELRETVVRGCARGRKIELIAAAYPGQGTRELRIGEAVPAGDRSRGRSPERRGNRRNVLLKRYGAADAGVEIAPCADHIVHCFFAIDS